MTKRTGTTTFDDQIAGLLTRRGKSANASPDDGEEQHAEARKRIRDARVIGFHAPIERMHATSPDRFDVPMAALDRKFEAHSQGRKLPGHSFVEIVGSTLAPHGRGWGDPKSPARYHEALEMTRGDAGWLISAEASKHFDGFQQAGSPSHERVTRRVPAKDFRDSPTKIAGLPEMPATSEHGEFRHVTVEGVSEPLVVVTKGGIFSLTDEVLVNDDMEAFLNLMEAAAISGENTEATLFWDLAQAGSGSNGPTCSDGIQYYNASHGNLLTGAAPDETAVGLAIAAMANQTAVDGEMLINVKPKYLVCSPSVELVARKTVTQSGADLEVLSEARIASGSWYLFADPARNPAFFHAQLNGSRPRLESQRGWDIAGFKFRVIVDAGFGAGDWRASVRNPGA